VGYVIDRLVPWCVSPPFILLIFSSPRTRSHPLFYQVRLPRRCPRLPPLPDHLHRRGDEERRCGRHRVLWPGRVQADVAS
jgi:hypothetical protein